MAVTSTIARGITQTLEQMSPYQNSLSSSPYNQTPGDGSLAFETQGGSSNGTHLLPLPTYYSALYRAIAVTLSSIIFTVGFVGNVLVVIVIARTRSMHTTTNCYLLSLAVADCLVLLAATLPAVPETFFQVDEWPFGRALCSILIYAQYAGIDASSLSIAAFTVERYIAICHPIRAQTICTVSRAKRIILALWLFTVVYCGPWLWLTDLRVVTQAGGGAIMRCEFRLARASYLTLYMIDLILFYFLPFVISAVLYCLIGRILLITSLQHARDRHKRAAPERHRPFDKGRQQEKVAKRRSDSRVQVIRMLIVVVVVFATLWMPYRVMVVYNSFAEHKYLNLWFLMFSRTLIYINCAINPILYNVMSVKFRRAFKNHLCCELSATHLTHNKKVMDLQVTASQVTT
ncbi:thyrotropin-releasing hormone receptor-like isoform X3 [Pomacea canaliculata]|uniref:thyrotropin-releasing hormone receptor-like isoform X3 n=1 Tax=Pomacea canaliculata TaxID=400727 RepID=UPI000D73A6D8|nr:thyrotropin-releasing hormone receptor-like isoform X3 [Pomacea canaliculata]